MVTKQEKPLTQAEVLDAIVEATGWDTANAKREVKHVLNAVAHVAVKQLKMKGIGEVKIPILGLKLKLVEKPATKARKMKSPFTGEMIDVAAKPKRRVVKAVPMKTLKDQVL